MPCWFYLNLLLCICNIFIKTKTDVYVLYIMDAPYSSIKFSVCLAGWVAMAYAFIRKYFCTILFIVIHQSIP